MEVRAEAFNITNSVRLGDPNTTLSRAYVQIAGHQPSAGAGRAAAHARARESSHLG